MQHTFPFLLLLVLTAQQLASQSPTSSIWQSTERALPTTTENHQLAVTCHNCYHTDLNSPSALVSTQQTLQKISQAIRQGADLIELDIVDADGEVRIKRKDTQRARGAKLEDILGYEKLRNSDAMLCLEIKEEKRTSERFIWDLLNDLKNYGYAKAGRPVVIRVFPEGQREDFLVEIQQLLNGYFKRMRGHVLLSLMLPPQLGDDVNKMQQQLDEAAKDGLQFVEFNYRTRNLSGYLSYARRLGLGTGLWTLPQKNGNTFIAAFRDQVDIVNTDSDIAKARVIIRDNNLLYNQEQLTIDSTEIRKGYLISAALRFTSLSIPESDTRRIIGRAEGDDFTLEIHNPSGSQPSLLRFGVKVNRQYRYAFIPLSYFNTQETYTIIGAYSGDGVIELFINQNNEFVTTAHTRGLVARLPKAIQLTQQADVPVVVDYISVQGWGRW